MDFHAGGSMPVLQRAMGARTVMVHSQLQDQWLVVWSEDGLADATWEPAALLKANYLDLILEDKDALVCRADDTTHQGGQKFFPGLSDSKPTVKAAALALCASLA
ncbi:unnamed protein product [Cuscuta campestris]|uniref:Chromo domain-containing protein n=1 Tax=Cuscuta campestris TaxID=132261 RepID=A0A484LST9_9ASTE|nr:unnamed protein product [Cuscuta campestris]